MLSDNASTYEAAANELEKLINPDKRSKSLCTMGIKWQFIPKRAPCIIGIWGFLGTLDRSNKDSPIWKILGRAFIALPILQTLIVEIKTVLNDRPLTYVSSDLNDLESLTPSNLL